LSGTKNPISLVDLVAKNPDLEKNIIAALRWKNLPTAMKYQQGILDWLRGDKDKKVAMFGDSERSYEIAYMWWQWDAKNFILWYNPGARGEYPQWYQGIRDIQNAYKDTHDWSIDWASQDSFLLSSEEYDTLFGTHAKSVPEKNDTNKWKSCTQENAVVIWEWPSAISCWIKNLFNTEWESWDSDFAFDWNPYISASFGSHTLFTTEDTLSFSQSDSNSNRVIDSIEADSQSFTLRNVPSSFTLGPKGTITLESYLQKGDKIVWDTTSYIDLVPTRIANLTTGTLYTQNDPNWEARKKEYLTISGSSSLVNGRAVWTIHSLKNELLSFEFETRIQSNSVVYQNFHLLLFSQVPILWLQKLFVQMTVRGSKYCFNLKKFQQLSMSTSQNTWQTKNYSLCVLCQLCKKPLLFEVLPLMLFFIRLVNIALHWQVMVWARRQIFLLFQVLLENS
jgi:hypothetical protein